jgi:predicted nuclease of predicted toxin-antitoxin system
LQKQKIPKKKKFRILLDSAFAKPDAFPKLRKKANLAHAVHDLGLSSQAEDEEIYQKAVGEERFVLTINFKDFRRLVKKGKSGILGIESQLTNEEIDQKVVEFLKDKDPEKMLGRAYKI